ncbi:MAG TPA: antibiotic biosynthesis monooxygenase [Phycisphaerales bacterium]|nr:antibiotic biosynthesis monooxygenase [Phycisphaerales bacterium]
MPDTAVPVICRYRVKPGRADEFLAHLKRHWATLNSNGLSTQEPARLFRCEDKAGNVAFVEHFSWRSKDSSRAAHQSPAVMAIWEPMGALCDDMEFWQATPVTA